ncbi:hypothetical protein ACTWPT_54665 [Nonomuraea sp. 3N208]|uniref:hypothetical protein n=1 Tax=Nonomuraea sp. 3N208 TaxID=3457421 RepID=UPI003FD6A66F
MAFSVRLGLPWVHDTRRNVTKGQAMRYAAVAREQERRLYRRAAVSGLALAGPASG